MSECFRSEISWNGTKEQKGGSQKMKKCVKGSVGFNSYFLAHHDAKKRLEIDSGWVGQKSIF